MTDLTNFVYNKILEAVSKEFPGVPVKKQRQGVSDRFPIVTVIDIDNTEYEHDLSYTGRKSTMAWQIDVYANGSTAETKAKKIAKCIASCMEEALHTKRIMSEPMENAADTTIYRYCMRYSCNYDEDTKLMFS